jgi:hypothetical protein
VQSSQHSTCVFIECDHAPHEPLTLPETYPPSSHSIATVCAERTMRRRAHPSQRLILTGRKRGTDAGTRQRVTDSFFKLSKFYGRRGGQAGAGA